MAENSKIEWCDSTFNPVIGCEKVSPGCANCYAEVSTPVRTARAKGVELWGKGSTRQRTSAANWRQPLRWNNYRLCTCESGDTLIGGVCNYCGDRTRRPRVFCASLSDWLDEAWSIEVLADLLKLVHDTPNLDWLLLSKRARYEHWKSRMERAQQWFDDLSDDQYPKGMIDYIGRWIYRNDPPLNVLFGATVEDQKRADERIPELLKIPAKVRFLSVEPMLEQIYIEDRFFHSNSMGERIVESGDIQWVICGGESGPKKRAFNCDWARSLRDQCKNAGVAFFMKQIDKVQPIPSDLMIREFPPCKL